MTSGALLSARERAIWAGCFFIVAALLIVSRFASNDPDSSLYAELSAKLSAQPVARWVAPEWWGLWPDAGLTGYFREHPAGLFLIPAALGRTGVPPIQASYIFGIAAGLISLLLASRLVLRLTSREDGRAALLLLQLMPVAFIFRIRDNHEYPMLVCLLAGLVGLDGVSRSWGWMVLVMAAFAAGLLVKGVFVAVVLMAAALWIAFNPAGGSRARQIAACVAGIGAMTAAAIVYDVWYRRVTGGPFWAAYWARQLGPMSIASPLGQAWSFLSHVWFYLQRLLFHPAPWSVALLWAAWRRPGLVKEVTTSERRGLAFALTCAALSVLLLSAASRFAERYAFSATYLIGAAGSVIAFRGWPTVRRVVTKIDAVVPAPAAFVWTVLIILRLVLGPFLPRIG